MLLLPQSVDSGELLQILWRTHNRILLGGGGVVVESEDAHATVASARPLVSVALVASRRGRCVIPAGAV